MFILYDGRDVFFVSIESIDGDDKLINAWTVPFSYSYCIFEEYSMSFSNSDQTYLRKEVQMIRKLWFIFIFKNLPLCEYSSKQFALNVCNSLDGFYALENFEKSDQFEFDLFCFVVNHVLLSYTVFCA